MFCFGYNESRLTETEQSVKKEKTMEQKKYEVTKEQILLDLKLLTDGIFEAEIKEEGGALVLIFKNGQTFRILVEPQS